MSAQKLPEYEKLPSGKTILKEFGEDGAVTRETHSYGIIEIAIQMSISEGVKTDETYIVKQRMVSRRSYEKARLAYADMPSADASLEDSSGLIMQAAREQQRRNKKEAAMRLAASAESRFPRPASTNWLRVISGDKSHLVEFASRDWKVLSKEPRIPMGRQWLRTFGFSVPRGAAMGIVK